MTIRSLNDVKRIDIEKMAAAIEADAGQSIPGLRESLAQAKRGEYAAVHTPEQIAARRKVGRPAGSVQATHKHPTTLRLSEDVLQRWRASGKGWQTRAAAVLAQHAP
jgi:uncharacterized protein (DUF4415 family)